MQKNSQDFSMEQILQLMDSPAGQQLLALVRQAPLEEASRQVRQGDYTGAGESVQKLLSSPEGRQLLEKLKEASHG